MNILQICAAYKPAYIYGGPTMSVSMLSENLAAVGVQNTVYTTTANGRTELDVLTEVPVEVDGVMVTYFKRVTGDHTHYSPQLFKKLRQTSNHFNLVHIHAWWNLVSLFSCAIALRKKKPVILSPRGTLSPYSFKNRNLSGKWLIHHLFGKRMLQRCFIHVTSDREKQAIGALCQPKKIFVLPNFVRLPVRHTYPAEISSGHFKLIFFSRIEEKKGLDLLIRATSKLNPIVELTVAGDGDKDYVNALKSMARECGVEDRVKWIGFIKDEKFDVLRSHDLFVLPSYDENFGNVVIESLSAGTPVLISEEVGLIDYVQENGLGWTCQTDVDSIATTIGDIMKHRREKLAEIRTKAPDIIYKDFNTLNLAEKYKQMYSAIING